MERLGTFGDRWLRRQRAIAETVRTQRPDFVALQETWRADGRSQTHQLGFELGMSPAFAPSRMPRDPHPDVHLGLGILSRFPLRDVEQHNLSEGTVALRAEIRLGARSLHFVTSCLDWEENHERERLAQAEALPQPVPRARGMARGPPHRLHPRQRRPGLRRTHLTGFDEDHGRPPSDHYAVVTDVPLR